VLIKDLLPFLLQRKSANVKPKQRAKQMQSPKKSKRKRKAGRELLLRAIILDRLRSSLKSCSHMYSIQRSITLPGGG
jgi:hypothetical protein